MLFSCSSIYVLTDHDTGVDFTCPSDPSRTTDENCDDLTVPTVPTSATAVANTDRSVEEAKDSLGR